MKKTLLLTIAVIIQCSLFGQAQQKPDPEKRTDWWGDVDGYINQQDKGSLDLVVEALKAYPPSIEEPLTRKMAFLMLDNVLHEEKAAYRPAVQSFFRQQIENAVHEIATEKVERGAVIWKLYNHTFIIKTPSVTIGFDIQRGAAGVEDFMLSRDLVQQLVNSVDILFLSHNHNDHIDRMVADMFLSQNKPVIAPPDIWSGTPVYDHILHLERSAGKIQEVSIPNKQIKLKVVNYPGHQGETMLNNVYLVFTPEGMSFSHTGDQSNSEDFSWIDHVGDDYKVDVIMTNSWSVYPEQRLARGFRPGLIIPGHENELGHTIDHREPYWLNNNRLGDKNTFPWIQMVWGEKYHYISKTK
ncbi:MAG TPA: hypothetical protein PLR88_04915 [Bacteroidales bacterium]|nr:hypothetical protein [Bacteroidales bacterium]